MEAFSTERFANPRMHSLVSSVTQTETQPKLWSLSFSAITYSTAQVHSALAHRQLTSAVSRHLSAWDLILVVANYD